MILSRTYYDNLRLTRRKIVPKNFNRNQTQEIQAEEKYEDKFKGKSMDEIKVAFMVILKDKPIDNFVDTKSFYTLKVELINFI